MTGNLTVSAVPTETKTITPSSEVQTVTPSSGKFLSKVTVEASPGIEAPDDAIEYSGLYAYDSEISANSLVGVEYQSSYVSDSYVSDLMQGTPDYGLQIIDAISLNSNTTAVIINYNALIQIIPFHEEDGVVTKGTSLSLASAGFYRGPIKDCICKIDDERIIFSYPNFNSSTKQYYSSIVTLKLNSDGLSFSYGNHLTSVLIGNNTSLSTSYAIYINVSTIKLTDTIILNALSDYNKSTIFFKLFNLDDMTLTAISSSLSITTSATTPYFCCNKISETEVLVSVFDGSTYITLYKVIFSNDYTAISSTIQLIQYGKYSRMISYGMNGINIGENKYKLFNDFSGGSESYGITLGISSIELFYNPTNDSCNIKDCGIILPNIMGNYNTNYSFDHDMIIIEKDNLYYMSSYLRNAVFARNSTGLILLKEFSDDFDQSLYLYKSNKIIVPLETKLIMFTVSSDSNGYQKISYGLFDYTTGLRESSKCTIPNVVGLTKSKITTTSPGNILVV